MLFTNFYTKQICEVKNNIVFINFYSPQKKYIYLYIFWLTFHHPAHLLLWTFRWIHKKIFKLPRTMSVSVFVGAIPGRVSECQGCLSVLLRLSFVLTISFKWDTLENWVQHSFKNKSWIKPFWLGRSHFLLYKLEWLVAWQSQWV